jgi:hypothetical protein
MESPDPESGGKVEPTAATRIRGMTNTHILARGTKRARELYQEHKDFVLLGILFASFRLMTLLLFEPGGYILDWSGYYIPGANFVQLSDRGFYPIIHYWMEYPPLFPWLSVLVYRLSMFIPSWRDPNLWYNLLFGCILLIFEIGNFVLIYAIALRLRGRKGALRCAWLYAGLFFPLMTLLFWFENFPLFFLLLGVYMIISERPLWGGIAAGIGFMIKFVPALVGPVALRVFPRMSQKITYVLAAALVAVLIALPFLLTNVGFFLVPFVHLGSIAPWESVWALLDGYYFGGETTPLETRFDLTAVATSFHESRFPYALAALTFMVVFLILYTRRIDWQNKLKAVAFCGLTISLFLIFSKGYSPQWIINLLPFIVLVMPNLRGVAYSLLLMAANVLEFPIALVLIPDHSWIFVTAVLFRTLLLVVLSAEFGLILLPSPKGRRIEDVVLISIVLITVVGSVPIGALAMRGYAAERYAENVYAETIDFLKKQPAGAVIFTDQSLYQQFYPFLAMGRGLYLLEDDERLEGRLAQLAAQRDTVWVVYAGSADDQRSNPAVEDWLRQNAFFVSLEWFSNARLVRYSATTTPPRTHSLDRTFAAQIALEGCAFDEAPLRPAEVLHVSLSWRSIERVDADYTVFVHLIDADERVWAQHDGQPAGGSRPTSSWEPGEEIPDNHGLALPPDIPEGEYQIGVGLYDAATGQRLAVLTEREGAVEDRVLVGPVVVTSEGG